MSEQKHFPTVYRVILLWTALQSVLVFARPIRFRLGHEGWKLYTSDAVLDSWVIDLHAITAFLWIGVFLTQFELGSRADRGQAKSANLHRGLGRFLVFGLVPVMSVLALTVLFQNPLGFSPFLVANVGFMWMISTLLFGIGVVAIRRGNRQLHVDSMYMAFITLSAVSTYRIVLIATFAATGMFMTTLPGVLTWVVVVFEIGLPLAYYGRLRSNRVALLALGGAFVFFAGWGLARGIMTTVPPPMLEQQRTIEARADVDRPGGSTFAK